MRCECHLSVIVETKEHEVLGVLIGVTSMAMVGFRPTSFVFVVIEERSHFASEIVSFQVRFY